jgi:hypothetical protein
MRHSIVAGISVAVFCIVTTAVASATDPPLKVLRHLSFDVTVDVESKTETKVAGFDGATSGTASDDTGSTATHGTIVVDVVGATADGGLVVDVSEDAANRRALPVRVGITDKALFYDPSRTVTEEERRLLHFLARDFVKPGELAPGSTWVDDMSAANVSDRATYKVTTVDADAKTIGLDVVEDTTATGPSGYVTRSLGTLTYDTGVLVPQSVTMSSRTNIQQGLGRLTTVDTKLTFALRDDSFRKK